MIDIHSHILPGVDDGARDVEQSLGMLKIAVENGVTKQVLTPHINMGRYQNSPKYLSDKFLQFQKLVKSKNIPIELYLSAEVRIGPENIDMLENEDFPWLGEWKGKKVFLLEFPQNIIPANSINFVKWLIRNERLPMIVHPERNREIQDQQDRINEFIDAGCLIQITAGSLGSSFGVKAKLVAESLLKDGLVTAIASDCHNLIHRPPNLRSGLQCAKYLIGDERAHDLVDSIPAEILFGRNSYSSILAN